MDGWGGPLRWLPLTKRSIANMEPTARLRRDEKRWSPLQPRALLSSFLSSIGSVIVGALFTLLLLNLASSGFAKYSGEDVLTAGLVVFSVSVMTASLAAIHHLLFGLPISLMLWMTGNFTPVKTAVCGLLVGGLPFSMISLASGSHHASELFLATPYLSWGTGWGGVLPHVPSTDWSRWQGTTATRTRPSHCCH